MLQNRNLKAMREEGGFQGMEDRMYQGIYSPGDSKVVDESDPGTLCHLSFPYHPLCGYDDAAGKTE